MTSESPKTLILVPTAIESHHLFERDLEWGTLIEELPGKPRFAHCGFGLAAAGVRAAVALRDFPETERVILLGIAGSYELGRAAIGELVGAESVAVDGIGAGEGASFESADVMGFRQLDDLEPGPIPLTRTKQIENCGLLVSAAAAAGSSDEASRRRLRHPSALIEDMEAWSVALACRQEKVPLMVVRAVSNAAGERDAGGWKIEDSLRTLRRHLPILLSP